jgi:hypothetical protein
MSYANGQPFKTGKIRTTAFLFEQSQRISKEFVTVVMN